MSMSLSPLAQKRTLLRRYLRAPAPLHFPVELSVPESVRHLEARIALYKSLQREFEERAMVGSDQFVYWDPTDPKKCLSPDVMVRRGAAGEPIESWKTWERGAPEVGIEIVSDSDRSEREVADKLERYRQAGIAEAVRVDARQRTAPLRLWDLFDGDLVERDLSSPNATFCDALELYWCIVAEPKLGPTLRLARDVAGLDLLPTPAEELRAERTAKEAALADKEAALADKEAALARVAELEAQLEKLR